MFGTILVPFRHSLHSKQWHSRVAYTAPSGLKVKIFTFQGLSLQFARNIVQVSYVVDRKSLH